MRAPALSHEREVFLAYTNARRQAADDDIAERSRADPVFAIAQVMVLAKIMLTVLVLDPRSSDTFTLPKSVAAHGTSLVIAALLVWLVARHGRAILFWSPLHVGAGGLLLAFALATPFAIDPTVALFGSFRRYLGLTQMLDNVLLYLAVGVLFRDVRSLRLLVGTSVGLAVPTLGYALIQRLGLDPLTFRQASTQVLPITFMGNPDIAGGFFSVIGATALGLAMLLRGGPVALPRIVLAAIGAACLAMLYSTGFRAGALGIGAGWLVTILLSLAMSGYGQRRALVAAGIAVVLGIGILVSPLAARLDPGFLRSDLALVSRLDIWRAAAVAVIDRPVLGVGPDNFVAAYPSRRSAASIPTGQLQNSTHDVWLYVATSSGVVGLAVFLFLIVVATDRAFRLERIGHPAAAALVPVAAYLGQGLVNVNELVLDWMFWASLGALASASAPALVAVHRRRPSRDANAVGAIALVVAAVIAIVAVAPRLAAGEAMLAAEAYANAGDAPEGLANARAAIAADPRRAEVWSVYGSVLSGNAENVAAVAAFSIAAERQPWHPLAWKNLSIVWSALGNRDAAYAAARKVPDADRYDGEGRALISQLAFERGDYARAASEGVLAIRYGLPARESDYFTTISAYVQLKDFENAEPLARELVTRSPTAQFRLLLAAVLADRGKKDEALAVLDDLIRDQPNNSDAKALRAAVLAR